MSTKYAVVGAGGWGTIIAGVLASRGFRTVMWGHDGTNARAMQDARVNEKYLPNYRLPDSLVVTDDAQETLRDADVIVSAVPTRWLRETWSGLASHVAPQRLVLSLTKGIEQETHRRPTEILAEILDQPLVAVLSGPSHAEEVANGAPTTVTVAAQDIEQARRLQSDLTTEALRIYANDDLIGVELGGALKNIIAIAAGILDGLGYGDNTKSALLTRGLAEISALSEALGARRETLYGMAGVGDLITTAFSPFGRNRSLGERIGRGEKVSDIIASTAMVFEGANTTRSAHTLAARAAIEMPITEEVFAVLEGKDPRRAVEDLMMRAPRDE